MREAQKERRSKSTNKFFLSEKDSSRKGCVCLGCVGLGAHYGTADGKSGALARTCLPLSRGRRRGRGGNHKDTPNGSATKTAGMEGQKAKRCAGCCAPRHKGGGCLFGCVGSMSLPLGKSCFSMVQMFAGGAKQRELAGTTPRGRGAARKAAGKANPKSNKRARATEGAARPLGLKEAWAQWPPPPPTLCRPTSRSASSHSTLPRNVLAARTTSDSAAQSR